MGGSVVKGKSCEYHVLADVSGPDNVLYGARVDEYIGAHKKREAECDEGAGPPAKAKKRRVK